MTYYLVRKDWNDPDSQIGAFTVFQNAVLCVDLADGEYFVFDEQGNKLYPEEQE